MTKKINITKSFFVIWFLLITFPFIFNYQFTNQNLINYQTSKERSLSNATIVEEDYNFQPQNLNNESVVKAVEPTIYYLDVQTFTWLESENDGINQADLAISFYLIDNDIYFSYIELAESDLVNTEITSVQVTFSLTETDTLQTSTDMFLNLFNYLYLEQDEIVSYSNPYLEQDIYV